MTSGKESDRVEAMFAQLSEAITQLRAEQRELARAVDQLTQTFRSLATHLGIAAEPYVKSGRDAKTKEIPGFG
ncbi:MAG TPA: hypothetical protein VFF67_05620 [Thermoplasmata archaeon]|nr:hypothetical protein [Thermoplasmata archaeon]